MKRFFILLTALLMTGCAKAPAPETVVKSGEMELLCADTGKSDFILIQSEGCTVINDAAYYETRSDVCSILKNRGVTTIDLLIISHFDKDHIGGAAAILREFDVERIALPDCFGGSEYWLDMIYALKECDTEQLIITEDSDFVFGDVEIRVSPCREAEYEDENDYSMITEVTFGETQFLLTGDALNTRMGEFRDTLPTGAHYDMIKLPHHGDSSDALRDVVKLTSPDYAVITSDAKRETVDKKTEKLLEKNDVRALYTDEGDILFSSDGKTVSVSQD